MSELVFFWKPPWPGRPWSPGTGCWAFSASVRAALRRCPGPAYGLRGLSVLQRCCPGANGLPRVWKSATGDAQSTYRVAYLFYWGSSLKPHSQSYLLALQLGADPQSQAPMVLQNTKECPPNEKTGDAWRLLAASSKWGSLLCLVSDQQHLISRLISRLLHTALGFHRRLPRPLIPDIPQRSWDVQPH